MDSVESATNQSGVHDGLRWTSLRSCPEHASLSLSENDCAVARANSFRSAIAIVGELFEGDTATGTVTGRRVGTDRERRTDRRHRAEISPRHRQIAGRFRFPLSESPDFARYHPVAFAISGDA